jgi:hypothetical protein
MPSHNYCCPAFISFFLTDPSAMMDRGFTVSGVGMGEAHIMLVSSHK